MTDNFNYIHALIVEENIVLGNTYFKSGHVEQAIIENQLSVMKSLYF